MAGDTERLQRMTTELDELNEKLAKLHEFLYSADSTVGSLPLSERLDLFTQHKHMTGYSEVLMRRVQRLKEATVDPLD